MKLIKSGAPNTRQHRDGANFGGDMSCTSLAPGGVVWSPAAPLANCTRFFSCCNRSSCTHWRTGSGSMHSMPTTNVVATSISSKSLGMLVTTNELPGGVALLVITQAPKGPMLKGRALAHRMYSNTVAES